MRYAIVNDTQCGDLLKLERTLFTSLGGGIVPIQEAFPSYYPSELLDGDFSDEGIFQSLPDDTATIERKWWVVWTKPRQEKAFAKRLLANKIPYYLPLVTKEHLIRGKRVPSQIPLFRGYVFLCSNEEEYLFALKTNRTVAMLRVDDQQQLYHDLSRLEQLIVSGHPMTLEKRLQAGQKIRVRRGPFSGFEGTIITRRGVSRLLIAVNFLQQGVSIAVDDLVVEQIE